MPKFYGAVPNAIDSFVSATPIVPSDVQISAGNTFRAVVASGGGNIALILLDDTVPQIWVLQPNVVQKLWFKQVMATGTTATGILGLN